MKFETWDDLGMFLGFVGHAVGTVNVNSWC